MRLDTQAMINLMIDFETAPKAFIDARINNRLNMARVLQHGTSMDLIGHIDYDPNQRNQGWCGNCWAWAGTGIMEVAHDVQDGVFDRLSLQFLDSCRAGFACCGGGLGGFATWYSGQGMAIPWSNTNAAFADINRECADGASLVACGDISTDPNYPIISIVEETIESHDGNAIAHIKNILNQNRAIYFWFGLPNHAAWEDFFDFWDGVGGETEASLWTGVNDYCGVEWDESANQAGSHAVLLLGYNDDDLDPANHYWLALNSWGTPGSGARPDGLFRIPMNGPDGIDYDCVYPDSNNNQSFWAFGFQTLDIEFGNALPIADAGGPYAAECEGSTTTVTLDGTGSFDPEGGPLSYSWTSDCPGVTFDDPTSPTPMITVDTAMGCSIECNVTLTVTDDVSGTDTATSPVSIADTVAPVITCPGDITVECTGDCGVDASDPQLAAFFASVLATDSCDPDPDITRNAPTFFNVGATVVTFTATDYCGNTSSCLATVSVVDTTPPMIEATLNKDSLRPPNHKLVDIVATVTMSDVCDPNAGFVLTSITSNEPDNGLGDGDKPNDIQGAEFGTPDTEFQLRAERSGTGDGRTYTIVYTAYDSCDTDPNNTTEVILYVHVSHDKRR